MGDILWYLRTIYRPRDAAKHFLVIRPKMETLFGIVALYGGLIFLEGLLSGEKPPGLMPGYFVIGWLGVLAVQLATALWWVIVILVVTSETHRFGIGRSLVTFVGSLLTGSASVAITMVLRALIL